MSNREFHLKPFGCSFAADPLHVARSILPHSESHIKNRVLLLTMGRVSRAVALAAAAAAGAEAFSTPPGITLRGAGGATAAATHRRAVAGVSMQATSQVSRRDLFSVAAAAAALVGSGAPSNAEMLKAKCTVQSCPDAPEGAYKIDKLEVKAGKYTGKGYQVSALQAACAVCLCPGRPHARERRALFYDLHVRLNRGSWCSVQRKHNVIA